MSTDPIKVLKRAEILSLYSTLESAWLHTLLLLRSIGKETLIKAKELDIEINEYTLRRQLSRLNKQLEQMESRNAEHFKGSTLLPEIAEWRTNGIENAYAEREASKNRLVSLIKDIEGLHKIADSVAPQGITPGGSPKI